MPDDPQAKLTSPQDAPDDAEAIKRVASKLSLTVDELIGAKPWFKSRGFNEYRWADHPRFNECVARLASEIEQHEGRKRRRTEEEADGFRNAIRALALDLYVAHKCDPELQIGVDLNANSFSEQTRYKNVRLAYRPFKAAFWGLVGLGYVQIDKKGVYDRKRKKGYNTKVRATDALITLLKERGELHEHRITRVPNAETILLKDINKNLIEFEDTKETRVMRDNLTVINRVLQQSWVDLEITDAEFDALQKRLRGDREREGDTKADVNPGKRSEPIDLNQRILYRVFNNASFSEGGRFYGAWWQTVPSEYREHVTINGKRTVELDFSGLHPRMLYAIAGKPLPDEPYDIGLDPRHRQHVKKAFNAIINAGPEGVKEFDEYHYKDVGLTWSEFLDRVKRKHLPVASYFYTGFGVKLQYRDSQIAEKVMLHFAKSGIPCLPVHDSFVMHSGYENELEEVMKRAYREIMGSAIDVKTKITATVSTRVETWKQPEPVSTDVDEVLAGRPNYQGYDGRLAKWFDDRDRKWAT